MYKALIALMFVSAVGMADEKAQEAKPVIDTKNGVMTIIDVEAKKARTFEFDKSLIPQVMTTTTFDGMSEKKQNEHIARLIEIVKAKGKEIATRDLTEEEMKQETKTVQATATAAWGGFAVNYGFGGGCFNYNYSYNIGGAFYYAPTFYGWDPCFNPAPICNTVCAPTVNVYRTVRFWRPWRGYRVGCWW